MKFLMMGVLASALLLSGCASNMASTSTGANCSSSAEEATTGSRIPHKPICSGPATTGQT